MKRTEIAKTLLIEIEKEKDKKAKVAIIEDCFNEIIDQYWLSHYVNNGLCSLCGNTGIVDTTDTAVNSAGHNPGRKNFCICPNGQQLRKLGYDPNLCHKPKKF